jgi:hypothetical protein
VDERPLTLEPSPATEIAGCNPVRRTLRRVDALLAQWTAATARPSPPTEPEYHFSYRPSRPGKHTFVARFDGHPPGHLPNRSAATGFRVVR